MKKKKKLTRRRLLSRVGLAWASWLAWPVVGRVRAAVGRVFSAPGAPPGYDPTQHRWLMVIDIDQCIGCGLCVEACKTENDVPRGPSYFRTWIERYVIQKPEPDSGETRGEVLVDSPHGGLNGFSPTLVPREKILKSFFVPKLCNLCAHSPCIQVCPVGATFDTPDGAVLVDPKYCIGCGFCIQACPYGCRFFNPVKKVADKCTLCYHRITRGLKPACVEICPTEARLFGDLMHHVDNDPIEAFFQKHKVQALKPHLGTEPRLQYAGMDKEVR